MSEPSRTPKALRALGIAVAALLMFAPAAEALDDPGYPFTEVGSYEHDSLSLRAADLNGDGDPDLIGYGSNRRPAPIVVLLGGDGATFDGPFPVGPSATDLEVADFDGDEVPDIAFATDDAVRVMFGDGDGGFGSAIGFGPPGLQVEVADFDSNGKPDVAALDDEAIDVHLNDGGGGFAPPVMTSVPQFGGDDANHYMQVFAAGQFAGSAAADLVILNNDGAIRHGAVRTLVGDGAGGFGEPLPFGISNSAYEMSSGDFDGDGNDDILGTDPHAIQGGSAVALFGDGAGGYESRSLPFGFGTYQGAVADIDGDGNLDLLTGGVVYPKAPRFDAGVAILFGDGTRDYGPAIYGDQGEAALAVADFNGDGKPDAASGNRILLNGEPEEPAPGFGFDVVSSRIPRKAKKLVGSGARVRFDCTGRCRVEVGGLATGRRKHGGRRRMVALAAKATVGEGRAKLRPRARRKLQRFVRHSRGRVRLRVEVRAASPGDQRAAVAWHRVVKLKKR